MSISANWCQFKKGNRGTKVIRIMKKFLEIYLIPNFPKWSDTKFRVSLKTVTLAGLSSDMDKKCYEK